MTYLRPTSRVFLTLIIFSSMYYVPNNKVKGLELNFVSSVASEEDS